jgi:hypothetical protein
VIPAPWLDFFVPFASMEHTAKLIEMAYEETNRFLDAGAAAAVPLAEEPASVTPLN